MKRLANITASIDKIARIRYYTTDSNGDYILKDQYNLIYSYEYDEKLLSYDYKLPNELFNSRYLKLPMKSCKFTYNNATYVKLRVDSGYTKIELLDDYGNILLVMVTESNNDYDITNNLTKEIYEHYVINEKDFDKVIILTDASMSSTAKYTDIHTSTKNRIAHYDHMMISYYDSGDYTFISLDLFNELLKIKNFNTNSGFLITEDFSKQYLGNYFVEGSSYV